jgi:hypothetical protein
MAGSKRWFTYVTDAAASYGINADESNTEAVNATAPIPPSSITDAVPSNIKPRRAFYGTADGSRTIGCIVLTQARFNTIETTVPTIPDPLAGEGATSTLSFIRKTAEKRRAIRRTDTGIIDGDAEVATT